MAAQTVLKSVLPRRPEMLKRYLPAIIAGLLALMALYATSLYSYLLFHTLAELLSIIVSGAIFILIWNTRERIDSQYVLFIGLSMAFSGTLDLAHMLAYSGMPIFVGYDANLLTQLWIAARYLQSLSLLAGLVFLKRKVPIGLMMVTSGAVTTLLLVTVFARAFPDCFIVGSGQTDFKKISEYIVVTILLIATVGLWRARSSFDPQLARLLVLANVFTIGSELAFTTYINVYDPSNLIGHLLRLVSVGLYYRAIVRGGLMRPLEVLHRSLNQSEARFRSYFELPLTGRAITSPSQTWLEMNSTLCDLLGYTPAELRQMTWLQLTHPDDMAADLQQFERVLAGEIDGFTLEKRLIRKDGQIIYTDLATHCLRRPDRSVDYFVTLVQDITERKRAEAALLENRTNLSALIENTDGSIWAVDSQYRLIVGNALFKHNVAAALGRELTAGESVLLPQFPPEANAEWQGYYDRALQGERFSVEALTRFTATPEYTEHRLNPIVSDGGRITGVTIFSLNITERKQAEEALRASEARWHTIINASPDGICIASLDGVIQFASDKLLALHGYRQADEMLGRNVFEFLDANYHTQATTRIEKMLNGHYTGVMEYKVIKCDGSAFFADINAEVLRDAAGQPTNLLLVERDVTARKQVEAALRESEAKYRQLVESLNEGIWMIDAQAMTTFVNPRMAEMLGYTVEEMLGRHLFSFMDEQGVQIATLELARRQQGIKDQHDFEFLRKDGTRIYTSLETAPVTDLDGHYRGAIAGVVDITERRRAEAALRESEEKFRVMADLLPQIVFESDATGRLTYVNKQARRILGYPEDFDILGFNTLDLYIPEDRARAVENIKRRMTGQLEDSNEYTLVKHDGSLMNVLVYSNPIIKDNQPAGLRGIIINITERKQAEERLRESEERYRLAQKIGRFGNWEFNLQTNTFWGSEEAKRLYGFDPQLDDFSADEVEECIPERESVHQALIDLIQANKPYNLEFEIRPRNTAQSIIIASLAELHTDEYGQPQKVVGVIQDITERKRTETELHSLNATLEQRVAERTAELQAANVRLTELDRLKDEFLSRISHELRTPLTSIKIYIELLETAKPEKREAYLQTLKYEADRLHTLIVEVLAFSQLNLNIDPSTLTPIDLNNLIEGRLTTWQRLSAERGLQFQLVLAHDVPRIRADGELLMQALTRLIANATQYTRTGSVTASTACVDDDGQRWATISVADTGPGITPEDLPHIFERFYRGQAAADYKTPGVGVGLSISREIAEKLGGRLTVETQVGVGSTFTFWLPAA